MFGPPTMPEILLRDELAVTIIGAKKLKRDLLELSARLNAEGITFTDGPLRNAHGHLVDALAIVEGLVPEIGAALAQKLAEDLPTHPKGEGTP